MYRQCVDECVDDLRTFHFYQFVQTCETLDLGEMLGLTVENDPFVLSMKNGGGAPMFKRSSKFATRLAGRFFVSGVSGSFAKHAKFLEELRRKENQEEARIKIANEKKIKYDYQPVLEKHQREELKKEAAKLLELEEKLREIQRIKVAKRERDRMRRKRKLEFNSAVMIQRNFRLFIRRKKTEAVDTIIYVLRTFRAKQGLLKIVWAAHVIRKFIQNFALSFLEKLQQRRIIREVAEDNWFLIQEVACIWTQARRIVTDNCVHHCIKTARTNILRHYLQQKQQQQQRGSPKKRQLQHQKSMPLKRRSSQSNLVRSKQSPTRHSEASIHVQFFLTEHQQEQQESHYEGDDQSDTSSVDSITSYLRQRQRINLLDSGERDGNLQQVKDWRSDEQTIQQQQQPQRVQREETVKATSTPAAAMTTSMKASAPDLNQHSRYLTAMNNNHDHRQQSKKKKYNYADERTQSLVQKHQQTLQQIEEEQARRLKHLERVRQKAAAEEVAEQERKQREEAEKMQRRQHYLDRIEREQLHRARLLQRLREEREREAAAREREEVQRQREVTEMSREDLWTIEQRRVTLLLRRPSRNKAAVRPQPQPQPRQGSASATKTKAAKEKEVTDVEVEGEVEGAGENRGVQEVRMTAEEVERHRDQIRRRVREQLRREREAQRAQQECQRLKQEKVEKILREHQLLMQKAAEETHRRKLKQQQQQKQLEEQQQQELAQQQQQKEEVVVRERKHSASLKKPKKNKLKNKLKSDGEVELPVKSQNQDISPAKPIHDHLDDLDNQENMDADMNMDMNVDVDMDAELDANLDQLDKNQGGDELENIDGDLEGFDDNLNNFFAMYAPVSASAGAGRSFSRNNDVCQYESERDDDEDQRDNEQLGGGVEHQVEDQVEVEGEGIFQFKEDDKRELQLKDDFKSLAEFKFDEFMNASTLQHLYTSENFNQQLQPADSKRQLQHPTVNGEKKISKVKQRLLSKIPAHLKDTPYFAHYCKHTINNNNTSNNFNSIVNQPTHVTSQRNLTVSGQNSNNMSLKHSSSEPQTRKTNNFNVDVNCEYKGKHFNNPPKVQQSRAQSNIHDNALNNAFVNNDFIAVLQRAKQKLQESTQPCTQESTSIPTTQYQLQQQQHQLQLQHINQQTVTPKLLQSQTITPQPQIQPQLQHSTTETEMKNQVTNVEVELAEEVKLSVHLPPPPTTLNPLTLQSITRQLNSQRPVLESFSASNNTQPRPNNTNKIKTKNNKHPVKSTQNVNSTANSTATNAKTVVKSSKSTSKNNYHNNDNDDDDTASTSSEENNHYHPTSTSSKKPQSSTSKKRTTDELPSNASNKNQNKSNKSTNPNAARTRLRKKMQQFSDYENELQSEYERLKLSFQSKLKQAYEVQHQESSNDDKLTSPTHHHPDVEVECEDPPVRTSQQSLAEMYLQQELHEQEGERGGGGTVEVKISTEDLLMEWAIEDAMANGHGDDDNDDEYDNDNEGDDSGDQRGGDDRQGGGRLSTVYDEEDDDSDVDNNDNNYDNDDDDDLSHYERQFKRSDNKHTAHANDDDDDDDDEYQEDFERNYVHDQRTKYWQQLLNSQENSDAKDNDEVALKLLSTLSQKMIKK